jgi:tRNA nucleotidyltransferase/poly(A) polymerase
MINVPMDKFNLNKFWEKTPTPLKYILVFVLFLTVSYFLISKNVENASVKELESMEAGIKATYALVDNFERFKQEQTAYNEQILNYIHDLHLLVQELNSNTNRKLDIILSSGNVNAKDILEKIELLNETFEKLSKVYENNLNRTDMPNSQKGYYQSDIQIRKLDQDPRLKMDTVKK